MKSSQLMANRFVIANEREAISLLIATIKATKYCYASPNSTPSVAMEAWLTHLFSSQSGLIALFLSGFFVAMLIPGGAEIFLFSAIKLHPHMFWQAIAVATLGNVLAGMTTYWVGRLLPEGKSLPNRAKNWLSRIHDYGQPIMLIAWVPWLGEAICIAAGWLRLNFPISAFFLAVGIFTRFWLTALAAR